MVAVKKHESWRQSRGEIQAYASVLRQAFAMFRRMAGTEHGHFAAEHPMNTGTLKGLLQKLSSFGLETLELFKPRQRQDFTASIHSLCQTLLGLRGEGPQKTGRQSQKKCD